MDSLPFLFTADVVKPYVGYQVVARVVPSVAQWALGVNVSEDWWNYHHQLKFSVVLCKSSFLCS